MPSGHSSPKLGEVPKAERYVLLPYERGGWEGWSKLRSVSSPSRRSGGVVEIALGGLAEQGGTEGGEVCPSCHDCRRQAVGIYRFLYQLTTDN